jgi:pSer/pThr/pTyr-binding forkhead associated (FHA) protein
MKIRLVGIEDKSLDLEVAFDGAPIRIGRDPEADVRLSGGSVSRHHCEIDRVNGVLWVRDLDSTQGTFVNGFHIAQSHLLPGDELTVGALRLRILYERDAVDWFSAYEREMALV